MKTKKGRILTVASMLLVGIIIMTYPFFSNWFNSRKQVTEIKIYEDEVAQMSEEDRLKELKKAKVYNDSLHGDPVKDPFVPGSGRALPDNYLKVLNFSDSMCLVEIPSIDVGLPVYHGTGKAVLEKGIGHMEGTSMPIGGKGTHAILTGHTGLPTATLFTDLIELKPGNQFYVKVLDTELIYEIKDTVVIKPEEFSKYSMLGKGDRVTLVTCTPYGVNSHRLLVQGERVYRMDKNLTITPEASNFYFICFICSTIGTVVALYSLLHRKKNKLTGNT